MSYQWNHPYQPMGDPRMPIVLQNWHQERGCPVPRPRSYSLSALSHSQNSSITLGEVSAKNSWQKQSILPLKTDRSQLPFAEKSKLKRWRRWALYLIVFALVFGLTCYGLALLKSRYSKTTKTLIRNETEVRVQEKPKVNAGETEKRSPPSGNTALPYTPPSQQRASPYPNPHQPQPAAYQPYQYIQPQPIQYSPELLMYQYNPQYAIPYNYVPVYSGVPQQQIPQGQQIPMYQPKMADVNQIPVSYSWADQKEKNYYGDAAGRKSWLYEHSGSDAVRREQYQQYQPQQQEQAQQQQQKPAVESPKAESSRKEERSKARNEARNLNSARGAQNSTRDSSGQIWEEEASVNEATVATETLTLKLRVEPAVSPFRKYFNSSDGVIVINSYEDDEDITVEVVVED